MNESSLTAELTELEQALIATRVSVRVLVEARILRRVQVALTVERRNRRNNVALAAAAVLLVGLHLSWWLSQSLTAAVSTPIDSTRLAAATATIRELLPDLAAAEAERQARLLVLNADSAAALVGPRIALPQPFQNQFDTQ